MKTTTRSHSSSLFLLELVIAIVIFALASALSLQFFAKAHLLNQNAKTLNFFSNECSIAAEITGISTSLEDLEAALLHLYPDAYIQEGKLELYYDETFTLSSPESSTYLYTISYENSDNFLTSFMKVMDKTSGTLIYELESKHYPGGPSL